MAEDEGFLVAAGTDLSADILKVSHHGSRYSSSEAFLQAVCPETAIISCGENNVYGHPHEDVIERLYDAGTKKICRTDLDGSVLVRIRKNGTYTIDSMSERKPLYENIKEKLEKQ